LLLEILRAFDSNWLARDLNSSEFPLAFSSLPADLRGMPGVAGMKRVLDRSCRAHHSKNLHS
jgi:hypothetical protein